jgi:acyl transferase domain-containing protein
MFSSVTSAVVDPDTALDAAYWKQNMVSPVRFATATAELLKQSNADFLIELGPANALAGPIAQIKKDLGKEGQYASALKRNSDSTMPMYEAAARLFLAGDAQVSLAKVNLVNAQTSKVIVDLPNYVWNHSTRYWHETRASKEWRFKKFINHDLIGSKVSSVGWNAPVFRGSIKLANLPWLKDHRLGTDFVFPVRSTPSPLPLLNLACLFANFMRPLGHWLCRHGCGSYVPDGNGDQMEARRTKSLPVQAS